MKSNLYAELQERIAVRREQRFYRNALILLSLAAWALIAFAVHNHIQIIG